MHPASDPTITTDARGRPNSQTPPKNVINYLLFNRLWISLTRQTDTGCRPSGLHAMPRNLEAPMPDIPYRRISIGSSVRTKRNAARRNRIQFRRHRLQVRHRIGVESPHCHSRDDPAYARRSPQGHRRRRYRTAVQLNLRHTARKRPSLDPACQRRRYLGLFIGESIPKATPTPNGRPSQTTSPRSAARLPNLSTSYIKAKAPPTSTTAPSRGC